VDAGLLFDKAIMLIITKIDAVCDEKYGFSSSKILCKQYYIYWDKNGLLGVKFKGR